MIYKSVRILRAENSSPPDFRVFTVFSDTTERKLARLFGSGKLCAHTTTLPLACTYILATSTHTLRFFCPPIILLHFTGFFSKDIFCPRIMSDNLKGSIYESLNKTRWDSNSDVLNSSKTWVGWTKRGLPTYERKNPRSKTCAMKHV